MFKISRPKTSPKSQPTAKSGFTMVEVMIAMAFVAVLLITIAIVTTNIVAIYQKGLTLKAVNSVGRGLVDELTASINTAPYVTVSPQGTSINASRIMPSASFSTLVRTVKASNSTASSAPGIILTFGILTTANKRAGLSNFFIATLPTKMSRPNLLAS